MHPKIFAKFFLLGFVGLLLELFRQVVYTWFYRGYEVSDFKDIASFNNTLSLIDYAAIVILLGIVTILVPYLFSEEEKADIAKNKLNSLILLLVFILPLFIFTVFLHTQYEYFIQVRESIFPGGPHDTSSPTFWQDLTQSLIQFPTSLYLWFSVVGVIEYRGLRLQVVVVEVVGSLFRNLKYFFPMLFSILWRSRTIIGEDGIDLYESPKSSEELEKPL